jgi:DNA-binding NtrC family response regulator
MARHSSRNSILLIEDDENIRLSIADYFDAHGYAVELAGSCDEGERRFRASRPDIVICDYRLPDGDGQRVLETVRRADDAFPFVIVTGHGSVDLAVQMMKEGASYFVTKPVELAVLKVIVERLLDDRRREAREKAATAVSRRSSIDPFAGSSRAIEQVRDMAHLVADADAPVLIGGETGTGKGVLAQWIHANGRRGGDAFVDINCAGLSRELLESELFGHEKGAFTGALAAKAGLFEIAHRGTAFLDEIGDIDLEVQPKLLKVVEDRRFRRLGEVQDRSVDVRLIAATHRDLTQLVRSNRFRMDLLFRINTLSITLPALRDRREDIPILAELILSRLSSQLGRKDLVLTRAAQDALQRYAWPGNVRELRNLLERAVLLTRRSELTPADLRFDMTGEWTADHDDSRLTLAEVERRHILRVLAEEEHNIDRAAKRLDVARSTIYRRLKETEAVKS